MAAVGDWAGVESAEGEDVVAAISNCLVLRTVDENKSAGYRSMIDRDGLAIEMREVCRTLFLEATQMKGMLGFVS